MLGFSNYVNVFAGIGLIYQNVLQCTVTALPFLSPAITLIGSIFNLRAIVNGGVK